MALEIKNALSFYKIAYAVCFIVILSLIRGVSYTYEIGIALEAPMAMLAAVFCADTYTQEITSKRSEVLMLYPVKKRMHLIAGRIMIQVVFLSLLAMTGYGLFLIFQNPIVLQIEQSNPGKEMSRFLVYAGAVVITLLFWGMLSNTFACFFRNMWMGIGSCLILWLITNSSMGEKYLGAYNIFSYTFREIENSGDFSWIWGKVICIGTCFIMTAILPGLIRKRG